MSYTDLAPPGYRWEWVRDLSWQVLDQPNDKLCRFPNCRAPAVARLNRGRRGIVRWWTYCASHLYGRRIEGDVVKSKRLVADESKSEEPS